jgi:hypothetical protein
MATCEQIARIDIAFQSALLSLLAPRERKRMKVSVIVVSAVILCTALMCSGTASAQPHRPDEAGAEPLPNTDLNVWLRRLVGKYKLDGAANPFGCPDNCSGVKGKVDCIAIGTGPGVQCILNATWQERWSFQGQPILLAYLDPSMMLMGLDPGISAINMLLVNDKGLPEGALGRIKGITASFYSPCVNMPVFDTSARQPAPADPGAVDANSPDTTGSEISNENSPASAGSAASYADSSDTVGAGSGCRHTVRIEAKADANLIYMWTQPYNVLLQLRRLPPDGDSAVPAN